MLITQLNLGRIAKSRVVLKSSRSELQDSDILILLLKLIKFRPFYEGFTFAASYRGRICRNVDLSRITQMSQKN